MDIRLPDGTIVRNVPEGTTKADLMARLERTMPADRFAAIKGEGQVVKPPTPFRPSGETALSPGEEILANPYGRAAVGLAKPFIGTGQLALNAVGQGEGINRSMRDLAASTAKAREYVGSRGVDLADMTGQGLALAVPAGMMGNAATMTGRIGQGALLGGAAGAATPVEDAQDTGDYFGKKAVQTASGAAIGAAVPGAWELAKAGGRGVRNVVQPHMGQWGADRAAGRLANTAAGDKQAEIVAALRNPDQFVEGSMPTAAQAAAKTNSAEFPAVMEIAAQRKPTPYVESGQRQNQARIAALRTVGKTPADIQTAIDARKVATGPQREANLVSANTLHGGVQANDVIAGIESKLAKPGIRASDVVQKTLGDVKAKIESLSKNGVIDARDLYTIRKEIGNTIDRYATEARNWDKRLTAGIERDVQGYIDDSIEKAGGSTWRDYLAKYRDMSKPIEQMKIGQELERKLVPALSEDAKQKAAAYANALRESGPDLNAVMRPDQLQTLRGVKHDLERDALTNALASKGMPAARRLLVETVPDAPSPGIFNQTVAALRAGYNRIGGKATDKIIDDLAILGQNPQEVARVMELAKPFQRRALVDALMRYQAPATVAATNEGVE